MKVLCPICHCEGILEKRGNSKRIIHYQYIDGKRTFSKHTVNLEMGTAMGTLGTDMGTENLVSNSFEKLNGAVERIRTFDRLVNSQPLYRAEPRRHKMCLPHFEFH
jgi:hypothetical protein